MFGALYHSECNWLASCQLQGLYHDACQQLGVSQVAIHHGTPCINT